MNFSNMEMVQLTKFIALN